MLANPPRDAELLDLKRQAFLLDQLNSAPEGTITRSQANKQILKPIQKELTITPVAADGLREALSSRGFLTQRKTSRSVLYTLTDAGRAWLEAHREHIPATPPKPAPRKKLEPKPKPVPKAVVHVPIHVSREAYLLLHLLDAPEDGRTASDLRKQAGSKQLELHDAATAGQLLSELIERQFIVLTHMPRSDKYNLTPTGQSHLLTLSVDGSVKVTLSGSALTKLLQAARSGSSAAPAPEQASTPTPQPMDAPTAGQLEVAVMEIFVKLRRELNTKLVPIHNLRSAVHSQFGAEAASHAVFDEVVLGLRRAKKIRLISISDRSRATADQLRDSIIGVGETFFYLESVDESASG